MKYKKNQEENLIFECVREILVWCRADPVFYPPILKRIEGGSNPPPPPLVLTAPKKRGPEKVNQKGRIWWKIKAFGSLAGKM